MEEISSSLTKKNQRSFHSVIKVINKLYEKLGSLENLNSSLKKLPWKIKTNIILQFTSLLFFLPTEISIHLNKDFKNWIDIYEYYNNPTEIFIEFKKKIIQEEYIKTFSFNYELIKDKGWNELFNNIEWGKFSESLCHNFIWIKNHVKPQNELNEVITFEIFDILIKSLQIMNESFEMKNGVVYTPYLLASSIMTRSLFQWIEKSLNISLNSLSFLEDLQNLSDEEKKQLKNLLTNIKILDPAVGTGVFFFAAANLLKNILTFLMPEYSINEIKSKILTNNIFGIELDTLGIQISIIKIFIWFLDGEESYIKYNSIPKINIFEGNTLFGFQTVPEILLKGKNNNYKINYSMDSLDRQFELISSKNLAIYEIYSSNNLMQLVTIIEDKIRKFISHSDFKFFILEGDRIQWNQNKYMVSTILIRKVHYSLPSNNDGLYHFYAVFKKKLALNSYNDLKASFLEFKEFFIPKKFHWIKIDRTNKPKFDLIITNPPFIGLTDLPLISRERLKSHYSNIYSGNNDLSYFFIKRSLDVLNRNGILAFILPKYFIHSLYAKKIRDYISSLTRISEIHDISDIQIFQNINIKNIILFLEKNNSTPDHKLNFIKYYKKSSQVIIEKTHIKQSELTPDKWILVSARNNQLLLKIKNSTKIKLRDIADISKGVETGCDKVFTPNKPNFFTRELKINMNHVKPWIKGKNIKRFFVEISDREVLFCPYYRENAIRTNKEVMLYLNAKKSLLMNRSRVSRYYLWRLGDERRTMNWDCPKIVSPYKTVRNTFAIDWKGSLSSKDVIWIIPKDTENNVLLLIVGLLNSNVLNYFAICTNKNLGGIYEYYPKQIENFPMILPDKDSKDFKNICSLVSNIIKNSQNDSIKKDFENQLNKIFYGLYSLSNSDIELIESFT